LPQLGFVEYRYPSALQLQNAPTAQLMDHSVHMNDTRSDGIGEEYLSEWKVEG
jgi:hypothetical protein